jgi:hypothetical protein
VERDAVNRRDAELDERRVRRRHRRGEHVAAQVRRVVLPARRGRDDVVRGLRLTVGAGERKRLAQRRGEVNLPDPLRRLRVDVEQWAKKTLPLPTGRPPKQQS